MNKTEKAQVVKAVKDVMLQQVIDEVGKQTKQKIQDVVAEYLASKEAEACINKMAQEQLYEYLTEDYWDYVDEAIHKSKFYERIQKTLVDKLKAVKL